LIPLHESPAGPGCMAFLLAGCMTLLLATFAQEGRAAGAEDVVLAQEGEAACVIVVPPESEVCRYAAGHLQEYIEQVCGEAPLIEEAGKLQALPTGKAIVAVGTAEGFADLSGFDVSDALVHVERDGYVLKTVTVNDRDFALALGKTETGAANATWRLMRELLVADGAVAAPRLDVSTSPFIKGRDVVICSPWNRAGLRVGEMADALKRKYRPRSWPADRLRRLVRLLASFGYNAVQLSDLWVQLDQDESVTRDQWRDKLITMTDETHKNGQTFTLFLYGSSVADLQTGKRYARPGACFNDPEERQVLLDEYDYQADSYAAHVDHVVTHWSDYGGQPGCDKCTIETALEQHNTIVEKFRRINPNIKSSFSMWNIIPSLWPGYEDYDSVLLAGVLPKDVAIAMPARLNTTYMNQIHDRGYQPAVWGWRLLDIEHWHGMHVHTAVLEKYFHSWPPEAGDLLEWYSADDVSQFLALSNLYVAAQLMWDPQRSGSELVREFTRGMFGPENAEKIASVLEAVEQTSCYLCPGAQPGLTRALEGAEERRDIIRRARETLAGVDIAPNFVPVFPQVVSPEELLVEISAQLDVIAKYNQFHLAVVKLLEFYPELQGMGDTEGIVEAFEALPKVPAPTEFLWVHVYSRYREDLKALREELGLTAP